MDYKTLISEIREEYHIPPFFPDSSIEQFFKEGDAYLSTLNPGCEYEKDLVARQLLKAYSYYAYQGMTNNFFENYQSLILTWQAETAVSE